MKTLFASVSVPANGSVNDVLTAAGFNAYFGSAATVQLYAGARAVGVTHNINIDDGISAQVVAPNGSAVNVESTLGSLKTNEQFLGTFAAPAGSKLMVNAQNTTAAAIIYDIMAMVQ